jgi:ribosomal protein S18 acetylase RimI-like enzyme
VTVLNTSITIRNAQPSDYDAIDTFLTRNLIIHRHLDWRQPLEWIGDSPYLLMEKKGKIQALLICPSDIENIYWIRLFAVLFTIPVEETFQLLFAQALEMIQSQSENPIIASIAYQLWMKDLLKKNGWEICQEVTQLRWNHKFSRAQKGIQDPGLFIRKMSTADVPQVALIDQICFEKIWQHSEDAIARAFEQSAYSTVAEKNGGIVGYQISTSMRNHAHIARLAVLPEFQRQSFGLHLINDVLERFKRPWTREITVNTQKDNTKSLGLYAKLGFEITNEGFPIYKYKQ